MILDTTLEQFLPNINSFKEGITDSMGPPYKGNPHYITFTGLSNGSITLNTVITVPTNASVDDAASTLTSTLTENATFGNVSLASAP